MSKPRRGETYKLYVAVPKETNETIRKLAAKTKRHRWQIVADAVEFYSHMCHPAFLSDEEPSHVPERD